MFAGIWNGIFGWLMRTMGDNDMYFRLDKDSYQQGELIKVMGNKIGQASPTSHAAITLQHEGNTINSTELRYNPTFQRWKDNYGHPNQVPMTTKLFFKMKMPLLPKRDIYCKRKSD
jgi:hypothetical protein